MLFGTITVKDLEINMRWYAAALIFALAVLLLFKSSAAAEADWGGEPPCAAATASVAAVTTAYAATGTAAATATARPDFPFKIYILIFEGVDEKPILEIVPWLEKAFKFPVEVIEKRVPLPAEAYNKDKKQYFAYDALEYAIKAAPADAVRVLAFFPEDMYVGQHAYDFGFADPDGRGVIINVKRLQCGEKRRYFGRLLKISLHELGHTFGLKHCNYQHCVMLNPAEISALDALPVEFCGYCQGRLDEAIKKVKEEFLAKLDKEKNEKE
jgi:archaemetzincin